MGLMPSPAKPLAAKMQTTCPIAQASGGVNVVVKAGQASVQVQDAFHVPLLELCLGSGGSWAGHGIACGS